MGKSEGISECISAEIDVTVLFCCNVYIRRPLILFPESDEDFLHAVATRGTAWAERLAFPAI